MAKKKKYPGGTNRSVRGTAGGPAKSFGQYLGTVPAKKPNSTKTAPTNRGRPTGKNRRRTPGVDPFAVQRRIPGSSRDTDLTPNAARNEMRRKSEALQPPLAPQTRPTAPIPTVRKTPPLDSSGRYRFGGIAVDPKIFRKNI